MVPLVAFGVGAFAMYSAYRYFAREWQRVHDIVNENLNEAVNGKPTDQEPITLVKDPVTGEYRAKN